MKNVIFDGQILQTDAWYRGMGRYTLQLLHQLNKNKAEIKLHIIFNSSISTPSERFKTIKELCPNVEQHKLKLPVATDRLATSQKYKKELSGFINSQFKGNNYFVITSLFTFSFFAEFPNNCTKVLLFYDLTPLLLWKDLGGYFPPHLYMSRFRQIYEADVVDTISETVRQDVLETFGLEPSHVKSINGGFTKPTSKAKKPNFNVPDEYILFVSADLPHKNNEQAARGFARFIKASDKKPQLIVTSNFSEQSKQKLQEISPNIIFSGNVADEELEWLYQNSAAVLFASKYEGLGIPILDAVYNAKPVIASRIPVFEEMSKEGFYYFQLDNTEELSRALAAGFNKIDFNSKNKHYKSIMVSYSWEKTAESFTQSLITRAMNKSKKVEYKQVALVCINPGINDQIGRLAETLHYELSKICNVHYFFDSCGLSIDQMERPTFLDFVANGTADINELTPRKYREYRMVIYLLDDKAVEFKAGMVAAVLPGTALYKFKTNNYKLVKDVVLANQRQSIELRAKIQPDLLVRELEDILSKNKYTNEETIIRAGRSNSHIKNKLLAETK